MRAFGFGAENAARRRRGGPTLPALPLPIGSALNGSANTALKAALARVTNGAGRAKFYIAGDSVSFGQGAGTTADAFRLTGARANRWPAALAAELTGIGYPALDNAFVGDGAIGTVTGGAVDFSAYDPRVSHGTWSATADQRFAGGSCWVNQAGSIMRLTAAGVDTFEIVYLNFATATFGTDVDGANPVSGPASGAISTNGGAFGFTRITLTGASASGSHYGEFGATGGTGASAIALASMTAYASAAKAIDIKVGAACGATSAQLATTNHDGGHWSDLDYLAFEAPDLTIILCGINDMNAAVGASAFAANLHTIIARAKLSGDVLLCFPYAVQSIPDATYQAYNAAAKAQAVSDGVAFMSFYEYFGAYTSALGARTADGTHPLAAMAAEIGRVARRCIQAMAA
ncbi:GDSL-type esterase/lipase family protein [uncultured Sphingomonas sp.]|uniref:GDSL-type esterase/lipase family protein n=1 Tax=uncultured Sphingomonas sp. TaxID=158754 RepID=UPI0035CB74FF